MIAYQNSFVHNRFQIENDSQVNQCIIYCILSSKRKEKCQYRILSKLNSFV